MRQSRWQAESRVQPSASLGNATPGAAQAGRGDRISSCSCCPGPWSPQHRGSVLWVSAVPTESSWQRGKRGVGAVLDHPQRSPAVPRGADTVLTCPWGAGRAGWAHTESDVPSAAAAERLGPNSAAKPVQSELCSGFAPSVSHRSLPAAGRIIPESPEIAVVSPTQEAPGVSQQPKLLSGWSGVAGTSV